MHMGSKNGPLEKSPQRAPEAGFMSSSLQKLKRGKDLTGRSQDKISKEANREEELARER
jgi:hypothetical protein